MELSVKAMIGGIVALLVMVVFVMALSPRAPAPAQNAAPWTRDVRMSWSEDGTVFGKSRLFVERAGVPSVVQAPDGRLVAAFQWFPEGDDEAFDRVAVTFSNDNGETWSDPSLITVAGATWAMPYERSALAAGSYQRPFDPTLTVTEDGRFRLYFTSSRNGEDDMEILSAISDDAVTYDLEDGVRMDVDGERNYDSAAMRVRDTWYLMTPGPQPFKEYYVATSTDGVTYADPELVRSARTSLNWTGNLVQEGEGMRFYGSSQSGPWWAYTVDGRTWTQPTFLQIDSVVGDPAVVRVGDRYLMLFVSEPVR